DDMAAFLALLPREAGGLELRHAVEVRSETFLVPEFVDLARKHKVAIVFADSDDYPMIADVTGDFVYARLQRSSEEFAEGFAKRDLDRFVMLAKAWERGADPDDLPRFGKKNTAKKKRQPEISRGSGLVSGKKKRDVFAFIISGAKLRNPAAARALIE